MTQKTLYVLNQGKQQISTYSEASKTSSNGCLQSLPDVIVK